MINNHDLDKKLLISTSTTAIEVIHIYSVTNIIISIIIKMLEFDGLKLP